MRLLQPLLLGASYICLFRSKSFSILGSTVGIGTTQINKMSDSTKSQTENEIKYESGAASVAFVTTPNENTAKKLAHLLVEQKLAACVNIIPNLTSVYVWEGKINEDQEYLVMIKTKTSRIEELTKMVRDNHPYSVAEVITLPIDNGNSPYLDWVLKSVPNKS
ncbi:protein CutA homolog [Condylostylus longicornis]|uniref:protein CutA homolog n=1 Tax=Condylostylus longicornis TaxID=2530218 RepID=UPI00244DE4FE|nr:protein CutA homolog [Condylostylus longicornis]